jgi:hypothetical protein
MTLPLQLFKNSIDLQEKLRLNLHSSSVSELLEYGRNKTKKIQSSPAQHTLERFPERNFMRKVKNVPVEEHSTPASLRCRQL